MHRRGRAAGQSAPHAALYHRPVLQDPGRDVRAVRGHPLGTGERGRDRAPLQPDAGAGQAAPAAVPDARRHVAGRLPGLHGQGRAGEAPGSAVPRRGGVRIEAPGILRTAGVRDRHHHQDGLPRLLPDRGGLYQLGQEQRRAGGSGPRFGRRFAGRVCARHHRPGSAQVRAAVRAIPEPRTGVDA